jgi:hypothetical protein
MLFRKIVFQLIFLNQRYLSKKCADNKVVHFGFNYFLNINQLVKRYQNAPDNILQGRPDNNYYEADRPHN